MDKIVDAVCLQSISAMALPNSRFAVEKRNDARLSGLIHLRNAVEFSVITNTDLYWADAISG